MPRFSTCSSCHRHVKADDATCPFCGFGPLRCSAPAPATWVLGVSLVGLALGVGAGCTGKPNPESGKTPTTVDPAADGGGVEAPKPDDDGAVQADPKPVDEPVDIYGGPRMDDDGPEPIDEPEDEPQPVPVAEDDGDDGGKDDGVGGNTKIEPEKKPRPAKKYGAPPRDPGDGPVKLPG